MSEVEAPKETPEEVPEKKLEVNAEQFRKSSALACNRQQISNQFQNLAVQQRRIQQVLAELNQERHEVTMIQENLKKTNLDRKCWRMVGGVLAEKTVADVLIDLGTQLAEIDEVTGQVKEQLGGKTKEMTDFREKYQIMVQGQSRMGPPAPSGRGGMPGILSVA